MNDYSIGIAFSNRGPGESFRDAQYEAAGELCHDLLRRYRLTFEGIIGHCHVSPGRKQDPWLHFHWGGLFESIRRFD